MKTKPQPKHTPELPKAQVREIGGNLILEVIEGGNWTGRPLSMFKAAPDLLAALKEIRERHSVICDSCAKAADAAIAKAEGR